MFKGYFFYILIPICTIGVIVSISLFHLNSEDRDTFQTLLKDQNIEHGDTLYQGNQIRSDVTKDIWFIPSAKSERLHFRIKSDSSQLSFLQNGKDSEIIENLQEMKGIMQESLEFDEGIPYQTLRVIESPIAKYNYTTSVFEAKSVSISFFKIPGHTLPSYEVLQKQTPYLQGVASMVSFNLSGGFLDFEASHLKAHLNSMDQS
jgi:hypothetical protein